MTKFQAKGSQPKMRKPHLRRGFRVISFHRTPFHFVLCLHLSGRYPFLLNELFANQKGLKDRYIKAQGEFVNRRILPVKCFFIIIYGLLLQNVLLGFCSVSADG